MGNICSNQKDGVKYSGHRSGQVLSLSRVSGPNPLLIRSIDDLHARNLVEHSTSRYELIRQVRASRPKRATADVSFSSSNQPISPLVLRRGIPFDLRINFARDFRKGEDLINLVFTVADERNPSYANQTQIVVPVHDENMNTIAFSELNSASQAWHAIITQVLPNAIQVEVTSSPNAIVGEYRLQIDSRSINSIDDDEKAHSFVSYQVDTRIILLFNSWNKKDPVYLRSTEARDEYVGNENGIIWRGTWKSPRPTTWNYSQYSEGVLDCVFLLLKSIRPSDRSDALAVSRHLSSIVNDANGKGVLKGNWTENFANGKEPSSWQNSSQILNEYLSRRKSVRYAQCWNFAGVLCTCLRAIGIPSRVVTCYSAAHDTHGSLTVDRVFNENLEHLKDKSRDSVWNFHTWVEMWCKRPDLDVYGRFDGWQVVDSTPQELSDNMFRCGPTSVAAVRAGAVQQPFDTKFVFAEVNADEVFWLFQGEHRPLKLVQTSTDEIGRLIVTKRIGSNDSEDITLAYKDREGSRGERDTMLRALKLSSSSFARYYLNEPFADILFDLQVPDDIHIGQPFNIRLKMRNLSERLYTLDSLVSIRVSNYTQSVQVPLRKFSQQRKLPPNDEIELTFEVTYADYAAHARSEHTINVNALTTVLESAFTHLTMSELRFKLPDINIQVEGEAIRGNPLYCRAWFKNPLAGKLTNGTFLIDGPGLTKPIKVKTKKTFHAEDDVACDFTLVPNTTGIKMIAVKFNCDQLKDVEGFRNVNVSSNLADVTLNDAEYY